MSAKKDKCPLTMRGLMIVNALILPAELGFIVLVMLCGDSSVSDGLIHWDKLAAFAGMCFTFNCVACALASK